MSQPTFFPSAAAFRGWLVEYHATVSELWVGFYRKGTGKGGLTYLEAVDEALCFGWIDGIRKKVDDVSYTNRFTPRKRASGWSAVNVRNVERLKTEGRMTSAGLAAFEARDRSVTPYSWADRPDRLAPDLEQRFKERPSAWSFFSGQPGGYRRTVFFWIMRAKQEATRLRRLDRIIAHSARGERLPMLETRTRVELAARRRKAR